MSHLAAATAATPFIDWAALGKVAGVSFVFGVAIVVLFSVGIVGVSWMQGHAAEPDEAPASLAAIDAGAGGTAVQGARGPGAVLAATCFLICAAAVGYGLYLIIPQFHN